MEQQDYKLGKVVKVSPSARNEYKYIYSAKRTKTKDRTMRTIIYGGGFAVEFLIHSAWNALCTAIKYNHGFQAWMATQRLRKEHKDKAWDAYCRTGSMLAGFTVLLGGNIENEESTY